MNSHIHENITSGLKKELGLIIDGQPSLEQQFHRVPTTEKPRSKNGWYRIFLNTHKGKEYQACVAGDWLTGRKETYKGYEDSDISKGELRKWKTEQAKAIKAFEEEQRAEQEGVAKKLAETFNKLLISGESDYLKRKGVEAHGLHFFNDGSIAIPARDIDENITTLQTINSNGKKRFSKGGKVKGSSHCIGEISEQEPVCFCEGYATGASIHEATGYAVVVCFDSGNIKPVIQAHRSKRPRHKFIIFADNDQWKPETGNVGVTKAKEAAKQYSCHWIAPDFKDLDTAEKPTDFNDFKQLGGDIKAFVANGLNSELIDDGCTDSEKINTFPELDETPCYRVYDRPIYSGKEKLKAGTYHHYRYVDKKTGELGDEVLSKWICTPLYIESNTHDKNSNNFGVFLRFKPTVGAMRQWCMPMAMLRGSGEDLKGELLGMGLKFDVRDNKKSLIEYINNQTPNKTIEISTKTGWYEEAFILPDHCIGSDKYFFQSESYNANIHYQQQGTLEEWQTNIAKYCPDNPLLILSVCTAFMGALLKPTHQEGGGFHIYGDSSKGKSTGMAVACSVFGDETFKQSWRATSNGLEAASAMANDSLLALDEISECDPKEIGAVTYALANGVGKQRANRNGGARDVARWLIAVLSNGERSIGSAMDEAGKTAKAGQSIRILNIPLFGEYGAFNDLHDKKGGRALADHLLTASSKYYGVAGIEYLTKLVAEIRDLGAQFDDAKKKLIGDEKLSPQEARGAKRFALAAMAGELATHYGITGWKAGDALKGVRECFNQWRADFGKGDIEDEQCLKAVKDFIDKHGDSRFSLLDGSDDYPVHNRAGYYTREVGKLTYLFNDDGMKEATKENGLKRTIETLIKRGWLEKQGTRYKKLQHIDGSSKRFYFITLPDEV